MNKEKESKIFQALGEASMCWSETPKGVFDSTRAKNIGDKLVFDLKQPHKLTVGLMISRTLSFPFVGCIVIISVIYLWFRYMKNYCIYGGESIAYTTKNQRKCISDVYYELLGQREKK